MDNKEVPFKKFKIKKVPKLLIATVSDIKVKKRKLPKWSEFFWANLQTQRVILWASSSYKVITIK